MTTYRADHLFVTVSHDCIRYTYQHRLPPNKNNTSINNYDYCCFTRNDDENYY
jgi:hypothetical protein